jgi:hypothetical protein
MGAPIFDPGQVRSVAGFTRGFDVLIASLTPNWNYIRSGADMPSMVRAFFKVWAVRFSR